MVQGMHIVRNTQPVKHADTNFLQILFRAMPIIALFYTGLIWLVLQCFAHWHTIVTLFGAHK